MKRIILSLSFVLAATMMAFAGPADKNPSLEKALLKEFVGAQHISWVKDESYMRATFMLNERRVLAWFSTSGELLGSIHDIFYNQLPLVVMKSIEQRFTNAAMLDIREVVNADGTRYDLTLEYKHRKYKASVYPDGSIVEVEKLRK